MNSKPEIIKSDVDFNHIRLPLTLTHEITWTVRNLNCLPGDVHYSLDSPPFVLQNATWCLRLYPNYINKDGGFSSYVGVNIARLTSRVPRHRLMYLLMSPGRDNSASTETADFDENHKEHGDMAFIYKQRPAVKGIIVRIKCQISCYGSHVEDIFSQKRFSERNAKDVKALRQNFKNLLLNGPHQDVTLKVMDKEFRAHRIILRARSPALDSLLRENSGTIDLPDCDPSAFEQFLIYLYSGEVDALDASNMLSLYDIAGKYDVEHLKEDCRDFIKESLSSGNIADVIQAALDHSDVDLLQRAMDYFVKEVNEILPTVEWLSCMQHNTARDNELVAKATKNMADLIKVLRKDM